MKMNILFSPIGTTDPWKFGADGAMLHIVRHYHPEVVYLFFTDTIWEDSDQKKGHCHFNWEYLIQQLAGKDVKVECIVEKIEKPHSFDAYKDTFHKHLQHIHQLYPGDCVLLNVTSGTPQMESTLCLEYITYPENKKCIQVANPMKKIENPNKKNNEKPKPQPGFADSDNQMEEFEEVNIYEKYEKKDRTDEIGILSFKETIVKNQVKELIDNYDYTSALTLLNGERKTYKNKQLNKKLQILSDAVQNYSVIPELNEKYTNSSLVKGLFHYLLLDLYLKRGDIANTLIRVKSIAEYLAVEYLCDRYPNMIIKGDFVTFNEEYQPFFDDYMETLNNKGIIPGRSVNLLASISTLELLKGEFENDIVKNCLELVNQVNKQRNSVAHKMEQINLQKVLLKNAVSGVKKLLMILYRDEIDENDLNIFDRYNSELMEII